MSLNLFGYKWIVALLFGLLLLSLTGCSSWLEDASSILLDQTKEDALNDQLQPDSELSPEDVVKIQVEALQHNDSQDRGIELTFRFASPTNKQVTGPLNRFIRLVKDPAYRPMLNHKLAEYDPIKVSGDTATQRVTIIGQDGQAAVYLFELSKQDIASCSGCWMTDSVSLIPTRERDLTDI